MPPKSKDRQQGELSDVVVKIKRCSAVVKGGRRFSFAALFFFLNFAFLLVAQALRAGLLLFDFGFALFFSSAALKQHFLARNQLFLGDPELCGRRRKF